MAETRTIDLKGLEHAEREKMIFPNIERLAVGDSLRLALEFNPVPLVFLLKARGEFETAMEKEGPQEWILRVTRTAVKGGDKEHLKQLLKELKEGDVSPEAKAKAKEFFQAVDATTLGVLEQELIREGVSHEDIRNSLCDIHLEIMRDSLAEKRIEVSAPHPVHTLMEEHQIAIRTLNDLDAVIERLKVMKSFQDLGEDAKRLKDISHFLVEMENHHQREEQAIFPYLRKHDIVEPPDIMVLDHVEFKKRKEELYAVTRNPQDYDFETYRQKVRELGKYLTKELESHIFKEDNILYQIALQTLSPEEWDEISRECDRVGYCFFTPGREARKENVMELDLRAMPPFERHDKIFETWDTMKVGTTLRIINDHDPRPLHYQFEGEYQGAYSWEYVQKGPKDWIVDITKTNDSRAGEELRKKVEEALARVRPTLQMDGGDVELVGIDEVEKVVTVHLRGACSGCPSAGLTLQAGIEEAIKESAPEVKNVVAV